MVNNDPLRILHADDCVIVVDSQDRQKIDNGPVYFLPEAQRVVKNLGIRIVTAKAADDGFKFGLGATNLRPFIEALLDDYYKHSERCLTSAALTKIEWNLDCDGYSMKWNRTAKRNWSDGKEFYLKFGFSEHDPKCLIVSIHD
jgi:hypothetical protein